MMLAHDEWIDLVDYKDRVIRPILKSEYYATKPGHFRAINAFIVNDLGQLWIPRRTAHKELFPLALDAGVGGHVQSGEGYYNALVREVKEEIQIDLAADQTTFLGYITPHAGVSAFMCVYKVLCHEAPDYNADDFTEYYWFYPHELAHVLKQGEKAKDDLLPLIRHFFAPVAQ